MENEPFVISSGGESNNTAGRDINFTFTHVDSTPCIDPYCDTIIAKVKAEIREGLCASCYIQEENVAINQVVTNTFLRWLFLAVLAFTIGGGITIVELISRITDININIPPIIALLLIVFGVAITLVSVWLLLRKQEKVKEKMNLHNKSKK